LTDNEGGASRRRGQATVDRAAERCAVRNWGREKANLDRALEKTNLGEVLCLLTPWLGTGRLAIAHD
jgi:hypothetical protein